MVFGIKNGSVEREVVMKTLQKLVCFVLVLGLAVMLLPACTDIGEGEETTTATGMQSSESDTGSETTARNSLPPGLDFGGEEVKILYWSDANNEEFNITEQTGSLIYDAVWRRDLNVQESLNVKFNWNGQPGSKPQLSNFQRYVQNSVASGDNNIEIIAVHSMVMGALAASGLMQDLLDTEYLDFEMPWWPDDLIENSTVRGRLYFDSGDISLNTLLGMIGLFFNKEMAQNDLYSYVDAGTWTLDRMLAESENVYIDNNGSQTKDKDDIYAYVTYSGMINPLFVGSGIRFVTKTPDGDIAMSETYASEKTQGLLQKVIYNLYDKNDWIYFPRIDDCTEVFVEGRSLFYMASVRLTINSLIHAENLKYGILPNPKYNEEQQSYHTLMANTYSMYGICISVLETDMQSAVIEAMACEGYYEVTPAVFETALKVRYSNDDNDSRMFDILRETSVMEIGLIFSDHLGMIPSTGLFGRVNNRSSDWISYIKSQEKSLNNYLKILNASFSK